MKPIPVPPLGDALTSGIVSLSNWTMMPDGDTYLYVWCDRWEIITDGQVPVENFRSAEKWQLLAVAGGEVLAVVPGCQVKGWAFAARPPASRACYRIVARSQQ
jgi:hypothetical protein